MRNLIFFPITTTIFKVSYILFSLFLPNFSYLAGLASPWALACPVAQGTPPSSGPWCS